MRATKPKKENHPPMITHSKTILKNKQTKEKTDRHNSRTNGKSKAIQTKSNNEIYTYTLTKSEKGNIYIYKRKRATQ